MDLLELQQRANILVDKVNQYEESLTGLELDENQVINEHKYVDIFCLRPVLKLLFGKDVSEKLSRTTVNDIDFNLISSNAPANNTTISFFENNYSTVEHPFVQNIDMWNNYNMTQLDIQQLKEMTRQEAIEKGIGLSYSSNIKDALVTESQVANLFNWNTTSDVLTKNNTYTFNRQVPGLVLYYLGNGYDGVYTATIPYNPVSANINYVNFNTPPLYGAYYDKTDITKSQVGLEMGAECCRIFLPGCNYFGGKLISPQQIWQPDKRVGEANINLGYNYQGKALYHELVFKQRRTGCEDADVDFTEALSSIPDNDPQGLATRVVLAQMKNYYYNRPWFNELYELYAANIKQLAESIINKSVIIDISTEAGYQANYGMLSDSALVTNTGKTITIPSGLHINTSKGEFTTTKSLSYTYNFATSRYVLSYINDAGDIDYWNLYQVFYQTERPTAVSTGQIGWWNGDHWSVISSTDELTDCSNYFCTIIAKVNIQGSTIANVDTSDFFIKNPVTMNDTQFYNSYKLDYNTFADALNLPK